jgi:hypothetical protein
MAERPSDEFFRRSAASNIRQRVRYSIGVAPSGLTVDGVLDPP